MTATALGQLTRAERMLAAVKDATDATDVIAYADFAADLARRIELGTASVNHALAIKAKAMIRLADIVDEGQARGEIAKPGDNQHTEVVRSEDNLPPKAPLPIPRQRLQECRQIRDTFTADELEQQF